MINTESTDVSCDLKEVGLKLINELRGAQRPKICSDLGEETMINKQYPYYSFMWAGEEPKGASP